MLGGGLFSRYFLDTGIRTTPAWDTLQQAGTDAFAAAARTHIDQFRAAADPNEAVTEERLIFPILRLLGWDLLPQQGTDRHEDIPDALLFADPAALRQAMGTRRRPDRFRHATIVHESKRWQLNLDRATDASGRTPASQALRYLRLAEELSHGEIHWALLTNGRLWRLYFQGAGSKAEEFLEADLLAMLEPGGDAALATFLLLFRRDSFVPGPDGRTFFQTALDLAQAWREQVTSALAGAVFDDVFPALLEALSAADPEPRPNDTEWPNAVRDAALILLYRLLFLLYAEDRDLLPRTHDGYRPVAITTMRHQIAEAIEHGRQPSPTATTFWRGLTGLFRAVAGGNDAMGMPPYNGGLFEAQRAPLLARVALPDAAFARVLDRLSMIRKANEAPRWINYRDLSVQQLGAIYEGLLERRVEARDGLVAPVHDDTLRHDIGAYYTPEALVRLVTHEAVGPLLAEKRAAFAGALARVRQDHRSAADKCADLRRFDPAEAFLALKICDPAMGSGHFLVSLVDWLADQTLSATVEAADEAAAFGYRSPLTDRIAAERAQIEAAAALHGWPLRSEQLEDRHIVRRLVLKRVIYGVDLNQLAVELAKLSLWLHSFTVGAPLSFLNHHLRDGDSLFGAWVGDLDAVTSGAGRRVRRGGMMLAHYIQEARASAQAMSRIEHLADANIAEVRESASLFDEIEHATAPLRAFLNCWHALEWIPVDGGKPARKARELLVAAWLDGVCGDPVELSAGKPARGKGATEINALLTQARSLARSRRFLHWQPAYPGVWDTWTGPTSRGGFDAVIGNPPYVRQEQLAPIKRALKARYAAYDGVADLYVYFFEQALRLLRPGGRFAFTVTNKWLKAGYAEEVRGLLAERAWLVSVTDFGHARRFFPGTDVFPSVVCARRPRPDQDAPEQVQVTVVPRDLVRMDVLGTQVAEAAFSLPRVALGREAWVLEPPDVRALLQRLRDAGGSLREYAGVAPLYGVKTGLNEAFFVDAPTRERLGAQDPRSAELLKPLLRGQDTDRWTADWAELWLPLLQSSGDHRWPWSGLPAQLAEEKFRETFPALYDYFWPWRARLIQREDQGHFWWELRPCAYYGAFAKPKICYPDITWSAQFCRDLSGALSSNTAYFLPTGDTWILACLNSPLGWWFAWRGAQHGKDEALRYFTTFMELFPIARGDARSQAVVEKHVETLENTAREKHAARRALRGWLAVTWELPKPPGALTDPFTLSADAFAHALRAALPTRHRTLSAAAVAAIRAEHAATVAPVAARLAEAARLENELSSLVNRAYGLTPEDERLMWATAPPRMPIAPPA
jgi:hypothetical protein